MSSQADEVARLKAELAALQQETASLEKKPKKDKKTKADAPAADAAPARKKEKKEKQEADTDAPPARRAYVGGLPFDATEESVANYLETLCGDLEKVEIQCFE